MRSPYRPWQVIEGSRERRLCRCFACERFYNAPVSKRELVYVAEAVTVAGVTLEPGWYCPDCLSRCRRPEPQK